MNAAVKKIKPGIDLRLNAFICDYWELAGIEFKALQPHLSSIRSSNYDEQSGRMEMMEHKRQFLLAVRAAAGDDILFLSSIGIRPRATPELVFNALNHTILSGLVSEITNPRFGQLTSTNGARLMQLNAHLNW